MYAFLSSFARVPLHDNAIVAIIHSPSWSLRMSSIVLNQPSYSAEKGRIQSPISLGETLKMSLDAHASSELACAWRNHMSQKQTDSPHHSIPAMYHSTRPMNSTFLQRKFDLRCSRRYQWTHRWRLTHWMLPSPRGMKQVLEQQSKTWGYRIGLRP